MSLRCCHLDSAAQRCRRCWFQCEEISLGGTVQLSVAGWVIFKRDLTGLCDFKKLCWGYARPIIADLNFYFD